MAADPPLPLDPNFRIELPEFEGPLDLLLHLVQKHELDVLDLPIAFVTERYLNYISMMQRLNLDVAAEYLVMAATLAHIKSKMLLPKPPEDQDDVIEDEVDPREELIRRLLEYQKYKHVAAELGSRGVAGRDVFKRGAPAPKATGDAPLAQTSLFRLIDAFQKVADRLKGDMSLEVDAERITIQERMTQVTDMLKGRRQCQFEELFEGLTTRYDLVVTFLALLEMAKMRLLKIYQADPDSPIHLQFQVTQEGAEPADPADGSWPPDATPDDASAEGPADDHRGDADGDGADDDDVNDGEDGDDIDDVDDVDDVDDDADDHDDADDGVYADADDADDAHADDEGSARHPRQGDTLPADGHRADVEEQTVNETREGDE